MKLRGVIITGTSGAGKSSVAEKLKNYNNIYDVIPAITTREKREDDGGHYIYIDEINYENSCKTYFTMAEYRNKKYAYDYSTIHNSISSGNIPVLIVAPESFNQMKKEEQEGKRSGWKSINGFLSFFIDASDEELNERLKSRDGKEITEVDCSRRENDRKYADDPDYIIQNHNLDNSVKLIGRLIELYGESTPLSEDDLTLYMSSGLLIEGGIKKNIKGASYDLRLGDEYYYKGDIVSIGKHNPKLKIEPYDYAVVSSKEDVCLPKDVIAHFGLTVGLFCQGIILSNGQQVDPGFRGKLFCLLFNTSNQPVIIKKEDHYATIEFSKMTSFANKYCGKYLDKKNIIEVIPSNAMQGGFHELKREIEELKNESRNLQTIYIGVISIIIAAISILLILR